jgi:hypothetical protein
MLGVMFALLLLGRHLVYFHYPTSVRPEALVKARKLPRQRTPHVAEAVILGDEAYSLPQRKPELPATLAAVAALATLERKGAMSAS